MIDELKRLYEERHEYAKAWKENHPGGKIVGYMCTYVPEEILYAADILPVRILGGHERQNVTERHLFGMFCPFSRDVLAQGLLGRYDYLDGIAISHTCQHIRQAFESWILHKDVKDLVVPTPNCVQSPRALPYLIGQLRIFKEKLEEWTGREIRETDLLRGIEVTNRTRKLMKSIYETRKREDPPISGAESMYMVVASQVIEKPDINRLLEKIVNGTLSQRKAKPEAGARLMMIGSENDDMKFVEMVESLDASIVIDDHCTGSRYFWNESEAQGNALTAIAERYLARPPCPIKDFPARRRISHLLDLAREWNVAGVLDIQQKFCDPHELDQVALTNALVKAGYPVLHLEFDVTTPLGQFRTRVEAFLETLGVDELF